MQSNQFSNTEEKERKEEQNLNKAEGNPETHSIDE